MQSFTFAADSLSLPKGSLSRQIQALENSPSSRWVQLTQDGQIYLERCRAVLATLEEMNSLFQHDPATLSDRLRVDMLVSLASNYLIPLLPELLQNYLGIERKLSSSDHRVDVIREGFDCVVRVGTLEALSQHSMVHYSQQLGGQPEGFEYFDSKTRHAG